MVGVIWFFIALLRYIQTYTGRVVSSMPVEYRFIGLVLVLGVAVLSSVSRESSINGLGASGLAVYAVFTGGMTLFGELPLLFLAAGLISGVWFVAILVFREDAMLTNRR